MLIHYPPCLNPHPVHTMIFPFKGAPMGMPAARVTDNVLQDAPHCHAPIHPPVPPTSVAHPALPLVITGPGALTVLINKLPAARVTDMTKICTLPGCVPGGPGMIAKGSTSVIIAKLPAARASDLTSHPTCVAPIPSPVGKILSPCSTSVLIG
jgi:uncharacterized Zn-binding protein involved in type VI secretion